MIKNILKIEVGHIYKDIKGDVYKVVKLGEKTAIKRKQLVEYEKLFKEDNEKNQMFITTLGDFQDNFDIQEV